MKRTGIMVAIPVMSILLVLSVLSLATYFAPVNEAAQGQVHQVNFLCGPQPLTGSTGGTHRTATTVMSQSDEIIGVSYRIHLTRPVPFFGAISDVRTIGLLARQATTIDCKVVTALLGYDVPTPFAGVLVVRASVPVTVFTVHEFLGADGDVAMVLE